MSRIKECLLEVLRRCKKAIGWQISNLKGICPLVCTHHIYMEKEAKPIRQPQRRLNPHWQEVVRAEVLKLLQVGIIYPISDSSWVSPTQVVPKKSGIIVVLNEKRRRNCYTPHFRLEGVYWLQEIECRAKKIILHSRLLIKCWRESLAIISIVSWMVTLGIFKLKLMLKIRRTPLSHVHLEHMPTEECLLVYVMHLQHSNDVC